MADYHIYLEQLDNLIQNLEFFNSRFRIKIFLMLNAYGEISLPDLTKKMGKSKSTISKHLKLLDSMNWITIREEKVRSDKKKKIYQMNVESHDPEVLLKMDEIIQSCPKDVVVDLINREFQREKQMFQMMNLVTLESKDFLDRKIEQIENMEPDYARTYFQQNRLIMNTLNLTEREAHEYNDAMTKFHKEFVAKIDHERLQHKDDIPVREYFAFNTVLPIKKMTE